MLNPNAAGLLSVVVPVGSRHSPIGELYAEYKRGVAAATGRFEFIFVLDGAHPRVLADLQGLAEHGEPITIVKLGRSFGEATTLMVGLDQAHGDVILTLPAYHQVEAAALSRLTTALQDSDVAIARRWPRRGGLFERIRRRTFHRLLAIVTGSSYRDLGCSARAMRREVLGSLDLYGDQHRFLPVLAERQGYKVVEVDVPQSPADRFAGIYGPRVYLRGLLDIVNVFFLARFTKKPLRFFGMVGVGTFLVGAAIICWLVLDRIFFGHGLADRPALLLASLLVVLGVQLLALGLIGELIIFTHASHLKDYRIETIVQYAPDSSTRESHEPLSTGS
jgi:hypothetical protein